MQLSTELKDALLNRLKNEFAETALSNFALDIVCKEQEKRIVDLTDLNNALAVKNRELMETVSELNQQVQRKKMK